MKILSEIQNYSYLQLLIFTAKFPQEKNVSIILLQYEGFNMAEQ